MILHWRIRTGSDWWFSKICRSGLDSDWKISQSAHFCWQCNANGFLQSALPFFYKKKLLHFTAIVTKNSLHWQQ